MNVERGHDHIMTFSLLVNFISSWIPAKKSVFPRLLTRDLEKHFSGVRSEVFMFSLEEKKYNLIEQRELEKSNNESGLHIEHDIN